MIVGLEVWTQSVGACLIAACAENPETMQSEMGRMARSRYSQNRMVEGRRRKVVALGEINANAVAHYRTDRGKNGNTMLGEIPKASR